MESSKYFMESGDEALRLELKTNPSVVESQARWAGIKPGMRVADIGCGPGLTTSILHKLNQPSGQTVGIDFSEDRLEYAKQNYLLENMEFILQDVREPLDNIGTFDLIWVRFLLEYYRTNSFEIVKNIINILKPGGTLCLIDLDHNCLNHYGIPERLDTNVKKIISEVASEANFDPFIGRKLYSYLYDLKFKDIVVDISAHHNIYGPLSEKDEYNWLKKIELAPQIIKYKFDDYKYGYDEFLKESHESFSNPRRFTYTPLIACKGIKPEKK